MSLRRFAALLLLVAGLALTLVPGTAAASNTKNVTYTIALSEADPTIGETVWFTTAYPSSMKNPSIEVSCYQSGVLVWGEIGATTQGYLLGGDWSPWVADGGGTASCTAELVSVSFAKRTETITAYATADFLAT